MPSKIHIYIKRQAKQLSVMLFLLPSLCGFLLFYLVPFIAGIGYALTDNPVNGRFIGFRNIIGLFENGAFLLALKNTMVFMIPSVFLNTILPLVIALILTRMVICPKIVRTLFVSPIAVPAATVVLYWQIFFDNSGVMNHMLTGLDIKALDWLSGTWSIAVAAVVYLWKNVGYNIIIYTVGLNSIPIEYYESADIDGAGFFRKLTHITLPGLVPSIFFVFTISIVNCFKVFREIYLIFGRYPNENVYMLQNFMNNMFLELNYPKLTSAAYIIAMLITLVLLTMYVIERKASENFF
jgi:multiple sugar transport system permease protein